MENGNQTGENFRTNGEIDWNVPNVVLFVVTAVISALAVFGNILTITSILYFKRLRIRQHALIFSLSVSDLVTGIAGPIRTALAYSCSAPLIWRAVEVFVVVWCYPVSQATVMCITIERYLCVRYPLKYRFLLTVRRMKIITALVWILPGITALSVSLSTINEPELMKCRWARIWVEVDTFYGFILYLSLCLGLVVLSTGIVIEARKQMKLVSQVATVRAKRKKQEQRLVFALFIVAILYIVTIAPHYISAFLRYFRVYSVGSIGVTFMHIAFSCIIFTNTATNFLIYAFRVKTFRKAYLALLTCKCKKRQKALPFTSASGNYTNISKSNANAPRSPVYSIKILHNIKHSETEHQIVKDVTVNVDSDRKPLVKVDVKNSVTVQECKSDAVVVQDKHSSFPVRGNPDIDIHINNTMNISHLTNISTCSLYPENTLMHLRRTISDPSVTTLEVTQSVQMHSRVRKSCSDSEEHCSSLSRFFRDNTAKGKSGKAKITSGHIHKFCYQNEAFDSDEGMDDTNTTC